MRQDDTQDRLRAMLDGRMKLGNELLEAAAARQAAQEAVEQADRDYAAAHKAAIAGGWTAAELRKAGLRPIAAPRKKRPAASPQSNPPHETQAPASTEEETD